MLAESSCNVLIVDDCPENLLAMDAVLASLPHVNLVHAHGGEEALMHILKQRFALMLLDVNMPDMDGYQVARFVSGSPRTKYLPIIMMTSQRHSEADLLKAYECGAVDYIFKPI